MSRRRRRPLSEDVPGTSASGWFNLIIMVFVLVAVVLGAHHFGQSMSSLLDAVAPAETPERATEPERDAPGVSLEGVDPPAPSSDEEGETPPAAPASEEEGQEAPEALPDLGSDEDGALPVGDPTEASSDE